MFKFEAINNDCMLEIASHLDFIDIINLGKSSTRLQSFVECIYRKKNRFSFGINAGDSSINRSNLETILQEIGVYIESLEWKDLDASQLDCLAQHCPNVRAVKLLNTSRKLRSCDIRKNKKFFAKLETLEIRNGSLFDSGLRTMICSSGLQSFQLKGCDNVRGKFFSKSKNLKLKILVLDGIWGADSNGICDFVRKLKLAKFSYNGFTFQQCLTLPPECLPEFEELQLNFTSVIDNQVESFNFKDFKRLTHLALTVRESGFRNCNNILRATRQIPALQSLSVEGLQINAATLSCLGLYKNLQKIRFIHFDNTMGRSFYSSLHVHLPNITHLIVTQIIDEIIELKWICEMISSLKNLKYFSYSFMTWQLMNLILQQQVLLKRPTIEIGIAEFRRDDQEKVSVTLHGFYAQLRIHSLGSSVNCPV